MQHNTQAQGCVASAWFPFVLLMQHIAEPGRVIQRQGPNFEGEMPIKRCCPVLDRQKHPPFSIESCTLCAISSAHDRSCIIYGVEWSQQQKQRTLGLTDFSRT